MPPLLSQNERMTVTPLTSHSFAIAPVRPSGRYMPLLFVATTTRPLASSMMPATFVRLAASSKKRSTRSVRVSYITNPFSSVLSHRRPRLSIRADFNLYPPTARLTLATGRASIFFRSTCHMPCPELTSHTSPLGVVTMLFTDTAGASFSLMSWKRLSSGVYSCTLLYMSTSTPPPHGITFCTWLLASPSPVSA